MLAAVFHLLAQTPVEEHTKSASEEGKDVVLSMLVVGLVFVGWIVIGDFWAWRRHKREARRASRPY
jgi:hypothetical protein